ncbi:sigma factor [Gemmatimonas sp.]|uniref:sigma factor n=1 Tax=Gemmatimonas sp. TaxID=1962908 RepID=UPI00356ABA2A
MDDIDRLFREYHQPVVRYLARRLGDRDLAEELAQETFPALCGICRSRMNVRGSFPWPRT